MSKDIAFHKHTLYQWAYCNRCLAKFPNRERSFRSIDYGRNRERPHIDMLIEALPSQIDDPDELTDFFNPILSLRAMSVLLGSAHFQSIIPGNEMKLLRYTLQGNWLK